jgi:uncharacterized protein YggE
MVRVRDGGEEMAQSISTPIEPGEQTLTAVVSLVFAIEGGR